MIALLVLACLASQTLAVGAAWGAAAGTHLRAVNKAALNKAVQEALAKAQAGQGAGAAGAARAPEPQGPARPAKDGR